LYLSMRSSLARMKLSHRSHPDVQSPWALRIWKARWSALLVTLEADRLVVNRPSGYCRESGSLVELVT